MTKRLSLEGRAYTLAGLYAATSQYDEMKADVLHHLRAVAAEARAEGPANWTECQDCGNRIKPGQEHPATNHPDAPPVCWGCGPGGGWQSRAVAAEKLAVEARADLDDEVEARYGYALQKTEQRGREQALEWAARQCEITCEEWDPAEAMKRNWRDICFGMALRIRRGPDSERGGEDA